MKQQLNPGIAVGIIVGVIVIAIGYFIFRGQQNTREAANVAQKGQQAGEKMRQRMSVGGSGGFSAPGQQAGQRMMQQMGQSNGQP